MLLIGILGGTFDPIHHGHLQLALEVCKQLQLDQVKLIPANIPPHRTKPVAHANHRASMVELAIIDQPKLCIDLCELKRNTISYTIDTLRLLRKKHQTGRFYLIIGYDAFNKIDTWKEWDSLLDYAHIIVANRPGGFIDKTSANIKLWAKQYTTKDQTDIQYQPNGFIYFIKIPALNISSSKIRKILANKQPIENRLPTKTLSYIKQHHLYQT